MLMSRHTDVTPIEVRAIEGQPVYGGPLLARPMIRGDTMTLLEIRYEAGVGAPLHVHDHESLIYIVAGRVRTVVGDQHFELGPGDVCRHPARVPHSVEALEAATMVEIKSPAPDIAAFMATA